ncbi:SigB/SigF/SigG family RNA polymerase sigma factor [uncultured Eubacterium sp.]|uniref:SigB/SigF/SigG family RNA polymerase sigma factor n=1 Tax=uncultured Eubacterium sp. TaxID=165185 RepID=UPI00267317A2|nr:SigB/SigF/SigG family RNA polymerase sigma factor [uncultured Eubacterium sp.]
MDIITLIKMAHEGDKQSRDKILLENTALIWSIVRRFLNRGYEGDDLFQIGCIGMLKAIDRFDTSFNVSFSTYAVPLITGEIRRFLRDDGIIKVSRTIKENQLKIYLETEKFRKDNNREPTLEELARECGLSSEEIITALEASREVESIYKEIDGGDNKNQTIIEKIEDNKDHENMVINRIMVRQLLETLNEKERKIIILRYFQNKTQSEIAGLIGMTQVQVSRAEKKILENLKKQIG